MKNIEIIEEEKIFERVSQLGRTFLSELRYLKSLNCVGEFRGIGFLYGIELVADKQTKEPAADELLGKIIAACKEKGLIIGRNGDTIPGYQNVLILAPPLSSTEEDLHFLVDTVRTVIKEHDLKQPY